MFQQNHIKRNKDAGAYNEYKFAGLTGLTENDVPEFFDNAQEQYLKICKHSFQRFLGHYVIIFLWETNPKKRIFFIQGY